MLVCRGGGYACYGKPLSPSARKHHPREYAYYRCVGSDAYRFGGQRLCYNQQVRTDRLEQAVWSEVGRLLEDPRRLAEEYPRRLEAVQVSPGEAEAALVEKSIAKVRHIARLIEGSLDKAEAEPRIRRFKERLQASPSRATARPDPAAGRFTTCHRPPGSVQRPGENRLGTARLGRAPGADPHPD